jgi:hypothetical protein
MEKFGRRMKKYKCNNCGSTNVKVAVRYTHGKNSRPKKTKECLMCGSGSAKMMVRG